MDKLKYYMYEFVKLKHPLVKVETTDAWVGTFLKPIIPKMLKKGYKMEEEHASSLGECHLSTVNIYSALVILKVLGLMK